MNWHVSAGAARLSGYILWCLSSLVTSHCQEAETRPETTVIRHETPLCLLWCCGNINIDKYFSFSNNKHRSLRETRREDSTVSKSVLENYFQLSDKRYLKLVFYFILHMMQKCSVYSSWMHMKFQWFWNPLILRCDARTLCIIND